MIRIKTKPNKTKNKKGPPINKIHGALNKKFGQAWWHMASTPAL